MKLHLSKKMLANYCSFFRDEISQNKQRNLTFILCRPKLHRKYVLLCNKHCASQTGGDDSAVAQDDNSWSDGIANLIYTLAGNIVCRSKYPVHDINALPTGANTIRLLVSATWNTALLSGDFVEQTIAALDVITSAFSIFITTEGSFVSKIAKKSVNVVAKVGATAVSSPFGGFGSEVIAVPSIIGKAANVIKKIITIIKKIYDSFKTVISKGVAILQTANEKLSNARDALQKANYKMHEIDQFVDGETLLRFMYDVFSVTFEGGPTQCKCWVNYILDTYIGTKNPDKKKAHTLYCFLSSIYIEIDNMLLDFVGSAIEMIVPQLAGIVTTILDFGKKYSYVVYRQLLEYLINKYHNECPTDLQAIIEKPDKLKEYVNKMYTSLVENNFSSVSSGLFTGFFIDKLMDMTSSVVTQLTNIDKETVENGIDIVGFAIHKCMGIIFAFLNLFVSFSEIYADAGDVQVESDVRGICSVP